MLLDGMREFFVVQGPVALKRGWRRKKHHLFLCNDILVISNNIHKKKFKIKKVILLSYLWMSDYADLSRGHNSTACKSIILFWPKENFVFTFCTKEQKNWWWFFLQRFINEAKKTHALRMLMEGEPELRQRMRS
ncbi:rho GTPase-activating protein 20-like [Arvicanthis niloticus]|uniref:rho GTPase-activating protein 20-like n=1 Tax=Arvicanthis niloticus TaxID=61156 RepID=UPI0014873E54|nr:rho GTPase-activating protein 20-like [Arvicanthis niloticus]